MRKKIVKYGLLGGVAYLIFLIATLPAAFALNMAKGVIPPQIKLYGLSGTIWNGEAEKAVFSGKQLDSLKWQLDFLPLLVGTLSANISARYGKESIAGALAFSSKDDLAIEGFQGQFSANELMGLLPVRLPGSLEGGVMAKLDQLEVEEGIPTQIDGTLVWHGAAVKAPSKVALGDLKVVFATEEDGIKGVLSDGGGPLKAEGILLLKKTGEYSFNGKLSARDSQQKALAQSLRFLGTAGPDGAIDVSYSGILPGVKKGQED